MRARHLGTLALALLVAFTPRTSAASTISITGGSAGTAPPPAATGQNNAIPTLFPGPVIGGFFGAALDFNLPISSSITVDFFGGEADFTNAFDLMGTNLFTHMPGTLLSGAIGSPLASASRPIGAGLLQLLQFTFDVNGLPRVPDGSNPNSFLLPNFFASCNPFGTAAGSGGRDCDTVYLFLDDSGGGVAGGGPDDDYDDMIVRVSIAEVPEPATFVLLGLGLLAGGVMARRRS